MPCHVSSPNIHILTQFLPHFTEVPCRRRQQDSPTTFEIRLRHHSLVALGSLLLGRTQLRFLQETQIALGRGSSAKALAEPPVESRGLTTAQMTVAVSQTGHTQPAKSLLTPKLRTNVGEDAKFEGLLQCFSLKHDTLRTIRYTSHLSSGLCFVGTESSCRARPFL